MTCSKPKSDHVELRKGLHVACRLCCIDVDVMLSAFSPDLNSAPGSVGRRGAAREG